MNARAGAVKLTMPKGVTTETPLWETSLPANYDTYPKRVMAKSQVFTLTLPVYDGEHTKHNGDVVGWLYVNSTDDQAILVKVRT